MTKKAVILFSGGQDSTTVLGWCLKRYDRVDLLSFDYGQNHSIELKASKNIPIILPAFYSISRKQAHANAGPDGRMRAA